jgi:type IV fimbrial biogenesis protein FimT
MVVLVVLAIMAAIAIPGFSTWLPNYRLKSAARDIYSNMQLAKIGAIKANANWAIVFDAGSNIYKICSDDGGDGSWTDGGETVEKQPVDLADYKSGVGYGHGNATTNATQGGGTFPGDDISYTTPDNVAIFSPRGTVDNLGYVYISNNKGLSYVVGTPTIAGVITLRKWTGADWE